MTSIENCIAECRKQAKVAYELSLVDPDFSLDRKPTPILFFPREDAIDNFHNSRSGSTEKMIYISNYGWRIVKFGAAFDWVNSHYYIEIDHKRITLIYT